MHSWFVYKLVVNLKIKTVYVYTGVDGIHEGILRLYQPVLEDEERPRKIRNKNYIITGYSNFAKYMNTFQK